VTTAADKMDQAAAALNRNASAAGAVGAIYKFVLEGEGGGTWIVNLKGSPSISTSDGPSDCTIKMAASDFVEMLEKRVLGQDLFFAGKLQIEGDMGLALKLEGLIEMMS
jgi:putative sterol carrier protein